MGVLKSGEDCAFALPAGDPEQGKREPTYAKPESANEGGMDARRNPGGRDSGNSRLHQHA